jgi:hypothetical protein
MARAIDDGGPRAFTNQIYVHKLSGRAEC